MKIMFILLFTSIFLASCEGCNLSSKPSTSLSKVNDSKPNKGGGDDIIAELDEATGNNAKIKQVINKYLAKDAKDLQKSDLKNNNNIWHRALSADPDENLINALAAKVGINGLKEKNFSGKTPIREALESNTIKPSILKKLLNDTGATTDEKKDLFFIAIDSGNPEYIKEFFSNYYDENNDLDFFIAQFKPGTNKTALDLLLTNHRNSFCDDLYGFLINKVSDEDKTKLLDSLFTFDNLIRDIKGNSGYNSLFFDDYKDIEASTERLKQIRTAFLTKDPKSFLLICKNPLGEAKTLSDDLFNESKKIFTAKKEKEFNAKIAGIHSVFEEFKEPKDRYSITQFNEKIEEITKGLYLYKEDDKSKIKKLKDSFAAYYNNFINLENYAFEKTNIAAYEKEKSKILKAKAFADENENWIIQYENLKKASSDAEAAYDKSLENGKSIIKTTDGYSLTKSSSFFSRFELVKWWGSAKSSTSFTLDNKDFTDEAKNYINKFVKPLYEKNNQADLAFQNFKNSSTDKEGFEAWERFSYKNGDTTDIDNKLEELKKIKQEYEENLTIVEDMLINTAEQQKNI